MYLEAQPCTKKVPDLGFLDGFRVRFQAVFWKVSRVSSSSARIAFVLRRGGVHHVGAVGDIRDMGEI